MRARLWQAAAARRALAVAGAATAGLVLTAHIGSPDVFFVGRAGPYEVRVVVRPPEVVPGVARVTVRTGSDVERVSIRPVFWRAGSRGAPSADETRRLSGELRTFQGTLWLMERGAYTVDVIVEGPQGVANVLVPVASVATGQLSMGWGLGALLVFLGAVLCVGLVNLVYKGAGESLVPEGAKLDDVRRRRAQRIAALALPAVGIALLGGARWWGAIDRDYRANVYRPSALLLDHDTAGLMVRLSDTLWQPGRRISGLVPDHGKLMHLFLVRAGDAAAFAHLHPVPLDSGAVPRFLTRLPPLPAGEYHAYGDVVHETGFERTLVGRLVLDAPPSTTPAPSPLADPDDAWHEGNPSRENAVRLADGSVMTMEIVPNGVVEAGREVSINIRVVDARGAPARLEPYLGMAAHAVVTRVDGSVYVHLHPMGTVSTAAQQVFHARDRGDTTAAGRVLLDTHAMHASGDAPTAEDAELVEFPYAFPRSGSYRLFVQVKRGGRIHTGAYAVAVAEPAPASR